MVEIKAKTSIGLLEVSNAYVFSSQKSNFYHPHQGASTGVLTLCSPHPQKLLIASLEHAMLLSFHVGWLKLGLTMPDHPLEMPLPS